MDEDLYIPGFTNNLTSGMQSLPTAQPVQTAAYEDAAPTRLRARTVADLDNAADMMMSQRQIAQVPTANAGVVSPFTTNPYMVVNYGEETNTPSFENTQNLDPTQVYRLVNQRTGEVTTSDPNDPTSLARLVQQANQLSGNAATKANWDIYSGAQGDTSIASDRPNYLGGVLGALVQYGLPIGLSLIPGLNWLGSAALAGAGSTAGKLISGYDVGDALKSGLITAGTAGLLRAPILNGGNSISGALTNAVGLGGASTSAFDKAFDADYASWLASGAEGAAPAFGSAVGAGGGGLGGSIAGSDAAGDFIQVLGSKAGSKIPSSFLGKALGATSGALSGVNYGDKVWNQQSTPEGEIQEPGSSEFNPDEGISVFANKYKIPFDPNSVLNTVLGSQLGNLASPDYSGMNNLVDQYKAEMPVDENEIVVTANKTPVKIPGELAAVLATIPSLATTLPTQAPKAPTTDAKKKLGVSDYVRLAGLAASALGGLGSKGGSGSGLSGARGELNPIFSAKLPAPNLQAVAPRALNFDAYRYGYGPEQSFLSNVPQGAANTSTAYTGYDTSPRYNATEQYAADIAALLKAPQTAATAQPAQTAATAAQPVQTAAPLTRAAPQPTGGALAAAQAPRATPETYALPSDTTPIPGLSPAQQLYYKRIAPGATLDKAQYDYVKGLSDYQALASLSNYDSLLGSTIYNDENGFRTMDELEAYYNTPLYTYGGDTQRTSKLPGYAVGGYAVGGPGDGREDKIPAMLSDGEYVIDAETVAMLGNGSSKAGAEALDKFRVNIRKHKGRKLSKGEFSVDAKKPEQYLKGHK